MIPHFLPAIPAGIAFGALTSTAVGIVLHAAMTAPTAIPSVK
jgi:hypothetical protein